MQLTRRQAATLLATTGVATRPPLGSAAQETPEQLLSAARERLRRNIETLSKVPIPAATEPAFQFRAS